MTTTLVVIQIAAAILLILVILLQHRGTGIGGAFGGEDVSYRGRRGIEKLFFRATIVLSALFLVSAIARLFI